MTPVHDTLLLADFEAALREARPDLDLREVMAAARFAADAHAEVNQQRKYIGGPYVAHPLEVALMVASVSADERAIAAALLHDVVEDTRRTLDDVRASFGHIVTRLVDQLTDKSRPEDGNRAERKAIDRARLAEADAQAQTVKLADLISNAQSIVAHDPAFARVYLAEKAALLEVLTRGDRMLLDRARKVLAEGLAEIGLAA